MTAHPNNEVLVRVDGVSKKFCRDLKKSLWYGVKDVVSELLPIQNSKSKIQNPQDSLRPGEFWANKDISFELRRGECLGLIGHNGAGKTTLLKMLNGLIKPDSGTIEMHGRVGALIALGAGFNPILTGRENVYVNGSILGLSKEEIDGKIDEIIDFADISDFIDSPVQNYSSGMQVRLGFAVAASVVPDILIIDEVLAVGDSGFRVKCLNRIHEILPRTAVIFVSHSMPFVARICNKGILMDHGRIITSSDNISEAIDHYHEVFDKGDVNVIGSGKAEILHITYEGVDSACPTIRFGGNITFRMGIRLHCENRNVQIRLAVWNQDQRALLDVMNEGLDSFVWKQDSDSLELRVTIPDLHLAPGKYSISVFVTDRETVEVFCQMDNALRFIMGNHLCTGADMFYPARWEIHSIK